MDAKSYVGDIIGGSLFVAESRTIADILLSKPSEEEFRYLIEEENVLQKRSGHTAVRYARTIRTRMEPMGLSYLELVSASNEEVTRLLLLAAFIHNSPIAFDFMRYALADAKRNFEAELSDYAWQDFFDERIRALPELARFSESSMKKMGNNMMKALADAGYIKSTRKKILQAVYVDPDVQSWLTQHGHERLLHVMEGSL